MTVSHRITENKGAFYIELEHQILAEMTYSKAGDTKIIIDHTEVSEQLRGKGAGMQLVSAAVEWARLHNLKIIPLCPFANAVFQKNPAIQDVLDT